MSAITRSKLRQQMAVECWTVGMENGRLLPWHKQVEARQEVVARYSKMIMDDYVSDVANTPRPTVAWPAVNLPLGYLDPPELLCRRLDLRGYTRDGSAVYGETRKKKLSPVAPMAGHYRVDPEYCEID